MLFKIILLSCVNDVAAVDGILVVVWHEESVYRLTPSPCDS